MTHETALTHIDHRVFGRGILGRPRGGAAQAVVLLAVIACCGIFGTAARWFQLPELAQFDGSLLVGKSAAANLLIIAVLMLICTLVGTLIAGCVRFEAGFFAACVGLMVISLRSGTMQSVLFEAGGSQSVFGILAGEMVILAAILGIVWTILIKIGRVSMTPEIPQPNPPQDSPPEGAVAGISALVTQAIATALILMFLCQSQAKLQTLCSVFVASTVGTMIAYGIFPARPSAWFWGGTLLVGLIGYLLAAAGQDTQLVIGYPQGLFAPLARPLPLDYASLGTAGAIVGYWSIRNKHLDGN
ncbi:MAG: hypothetical protein ABSF29_05580 [Tepidisphaeraceae bacterium]|jgi:hypothetical protein